MLRISLLLQIGAAVILGLLSASPAFAGDYAFCLLTNRVAVEASLARYSNSQVENGLCMATKEVLDAIEHRNRIKETICLQASQHMMREFLRRFPTRDPGGVVGRC